MREPSRSRDGEARRVARGAAESHLTTPSMLLLLVEDDLLELHAPSLIPSTVSRRSVSLDMSSCVLPPPAPNPPPRDCFFLRKEWAGLLFPAFSLSAARLCLAAEATVWLLSELLADLLVILPSVAASRGRRCFAPSPAVEETEGGGGGGFPFTGSAACSEAAAEESFRWSAFVRSVTCDRRSRISSWARSSSFEARMESVKNYLFRYRDSDESDVDGIRNSSGKIRVLTTAMTIT